MASLNKVQLIGNLGADPDYSVSQQGLSICKFRLATTEKFKDKTGETREETEWHRVVFFGSLADICNKFLSKGKSVYVEGRIKTSTYEKDGEKRYSVEIVGQNLQMLGNRDQSERSSYQSDSSYTPPDVDTQTNDDDNDVPF